MLINPEFVNLKMIEYKIDYLIKQNLKQGPIQLSQYKEINLLLDIIIKEADIWNKKNPYWYYYADDEEVSKPLDSFVQKYMSLLKLHQIKSTIILKNCNRFNRLYIETLQREKKKLKKELEHKINLIDAQIEYYTSTSTDVTVYKFIPSSGTIMKFMKDD